MAAVNSVMAPQDTIKDMISDAAWEETVKAPDSAMTLGDINRRLEELEGEFDALFQKPDSAEKNATRFREIANEMASLKEQREKLSAQLRKNRAAQEHIQSMENALGRETCRMTQWDEDMIRQLVYTVRVISADHIRVYLNDGTEIEQEVRS